MDNRCSGISFFCGMMFGAFVGAAAALLLAPQSGAETRALLKEKGEEYYKKAEQGVKDIAENAPKYIEDVKEKAATAVKPVITKARELYGTAQEQLERTKQNFKTSSGANA
ncbi:MAG: YtxH domain-containing protein [bacterium]|nr:YtxH domain-containing protein [bacterium]